MRLLCFQLGFQTVTVDFSVTSPNLIYARARKKKQKCTVDARAREKKKFASLWTKIKNQFFENHFHLI